MDYNYAIEFSVNKKMLVFEAKLEGTSEQYGKLDEAIRTARFVRNSCLRHWMDNKDIDKYDRCAYCAVLAKEFEFAKNLNSMARQASAERAWAAISRFYDNCKKGKPGKKGYPRFKKEQTHGSVEYKTSGWRLSENRRHIAFSDGFEAGTFKMWGGGLTRKKIGQAYLERVPVCTTSGTRKSRALLERVPLCTDRSTITLARLFPSRNPARQINRRLRSVPLRD